MKLLFAVKQEMFTEVFTGKCVERIKSMVEVIDAPIPIEADKTFILEYGREADIVVTSWWTENIDSDVIAALPHLKLVTHAAGSVKPIVSDALWEAGVRVTSSGAAIAYGVAEFCLGLILTAPKRAFWGALGTREGKWRDALEVFGGPFEIFHQKIGVIGTGNVGRLLVGLLQHFTCDVLVYDPYCSAEDIKRMGAAKVETLDELFSTCRVVSLNAPSTDETKGMIRGKHFALLQDGAVFINTARSAIVCEDEMIEELKKERFVACIDVTDPEPPAEDCPLRHLPNVFFTPHEAGAVAQNRLRMGDFAAEEIDAFVHGRPLIREVKREDLSRMG